MRIRLTGLTQKEIKKTKGLEGKSYFLDMNKLIEENFQKSSDLNNTQYWILNQIMLKKIESFISSKYDIVYLYFNNPTRDKVKAFKELINENRIKNVVIEPFEL